MALTASCYCEKQYKTTYFLSLIKASSVVLSCISSWHMSSGVLVYKVHGPNTVITLVFITGRDAIYICRHIFSTSCRIFSALGFRKKEDPKTNKPILFLSKQHERNRIFR